MVAEAAMRPLGAEARWQASQAVPLGMCEPAPIGEVGGMTTMRLTPTKLNPVIDGPWQAAQLVAMPA